jgi:ABC-type transporter Mla maintaining outer membrane lipid asymmetry ATPase subunit MlaF
MENATPYAVHVSNLTVSAKGQRGHAKTLLSGINFDLEAERLVGVIGASGCGKSTLIKALAGQIAPTAGQVLLAGHSIIDIKAQYPLAVGYLPQFGAFHHELTVEENLRTAVALRLPRSVSIEIKEKWVAYRGTGPAGKFSPAALRHAVGWADAAHGACGRTDWRSRLPLSHCLCRHEVSASDSS